METELVKVLNVTDITTVEFDNPGVKYLIKNFSGSDIYVSIDSSVSTSNSSRIPAKGFEVWSSNIKNSVGSESYNKFYIKGSGYVEVRQLSNC